MVNGQNGVHTDSLTNGSTNGHSHEHSNEHINGESNGHQDKSVLPLADRVAELERTVETQKEEIAALKNAMADLLRRAPSGTNSLPYKSGSSMFANILPLPHKSVAKPSISSTLNNQNRLVKPEVSKSSPNDTSVRDSALARGSATPSSLGSKPKNAVTRSSNSELSMSRRSIRGPSASASNTEVSHQKFSFNKENGIVKFFLRGRPINLFMPISYLPENSTEFKFDTEAKIKAPAESLKLEWVYGYRGKDCRSNLHQIESGEIIYFIAAVVVIYNLETKTQRHYTGHNDDIKSIAIHPNKTIIATGQMAGHDKKEGRPHVRIWNSLTLQTLKVIGAATTDFSSSIICLAFSRVDSGEFLAIVDEANVLSVWNWQQGHKTSSAKGHSETLVAAEFHPSEKASLITCGKSHVAFWTFDPSNKSQPLTKRLGSFELQSATKIFNADKDVICSPTPEECKPKPAKYVINISFNAKGEIITGDTDGNVIFWNHKTARIEKIIKNVTDSCLALLVLEKTLLAGGKDGKLIEWSLDESDESIGIRRTGRTFELPEAHGGCRSILELTNHSILIGTKQNCIYQIEFASNSETHRLNCIVTGHFEELWGLAYNQTSKNCSGFLTCGNDKTLSLWDASSHTNTWSIQLEEKLRCVGTHPNLELAAIGTIRNKWFIFDLTKLKVVYTGQVDSSEQAIERIQYSPNGQYLACACRDTFIYVYEVSEDGLTYTKVGKCSGHSSYVAHIDWSADSRYLISNSGDYETLYWDAKTCKQLINGQDIRVIQWTSTTTCTLTFNTLGLWHSRSLLSQPTQFESVDGTDINACCTSSAKNYVVSVDDFGQLNMFKYPCNAFNVEKKVYTGHSSHVTNVTLLNNDSIVISVGGNDSAIMQWKLVEEVAQ